MPRQNRVLPSGEIVADPARGLFMGNRGILHDKEGQLGRARWKHRAWICCMLSFKGRRRQIMAPNRYTELFFLDEAVALSAGHRPCAECRRGDYNRFRDAWEQAFGTRPRAGEMDAILHKARTPPRSLAARAAPVCPPGRALLAHPRTGAALCRDLPHGTFILHENHSLLLTDSAALRFSPDGYTEIRRPTGPVTPLTPAPVIAVLRAGYRPELHPSAS